MKICYIASDVAVPHFRGASTHVYELSNNLSKSGHEVHLIARRLNRSQASTEQLGHFKVHRFFTGILFPTPLSTYSRRMDENRRSSLSNLVRRMYAAYLFSIHAFYIGIQVSRIIRREKLDIIVERETSFGAGAIASLLTGRPLVLEVIGPRYSPLSIHFASKVLLYPSSALMDTLPPKKLQVVSAAVNTDLHRHNPSKGLAIRKQYGLDGRQVVGYVGSFSSWQGVEDLILASPRIIEKRPNVRFLMVGPYFQHAKSLAEKIKVDSFFIFTGPVAYEQVPSFSNAADILVAPYNPHKSTLSSQHRLGSPLKLFEYMACSKPVVGTSVKPVNDVIINGVNGLLAEPGSPEDLAEKILNILEDDSLAERLAHEAMRLVQGRYTWDAFTKNMCVLMEGILEEKSRAV